MNDKQKKERIRYLSDKLESLFNELQPQLKEFELIRIELDEMLKHENSQTEDNSGII